MQEIHFIFRHRIAKPRYRFHRSCRLRSRYFHRFASVYFETKTHFLSIILCCFRFYRIAVHGKRNRVRVGIHFYGDVLPFAYREAARSYVGYGVFAPIGLVKQIPHKTAYSRRSVCRPFCPSKLFQVCGRVTGTKSAVSSVFASKQNSQSVRNVCVVRIVFSLFLLDALIVS